MSLHQSKVGPSKPPHTFHLERRKPGRFTRAYHRVLSFWHWSQIGHRSEYSVERMLAFQDYYERTSITRVLAVCFLTPVPGILLTLLVDCIPLRDPSEGWEANYAYWIRGLFDLFVVSLGTITQVRAALLPNAISNIGAVTISLSVASICVLMAIGFAATWRFPVPFGLVFPIVPYIATMSILTFLAIGPRVIAKSPLLSSQLKAHAWIGLAQGIVATAYPLFTAVFYRLSGIQQTAFVFLMPLIKFLAKTMIAKAAGGLHCYVGMLVVFSVDVFNVLYIAICMQFANSMTTTVVMISLDGFHVIIGVRAIFHQINIARKRRLSSKLTTESTTNWFGELSTMMSKLLRELHVSDALRCRVRVFAPFPLPLSDNRAAMLSEIARISHQTHVYPSPKSRLQAKGLTLKLISNAHIDHTIQTQKLTVAEGGALDSTFKMTKQNRVVPIGPDAPPFTSRQNTNAFRKASAPRRLLGLMDPNMAVSAEYLLIAEYIEFALPMLYAMYLLGISQLPVAKYYPQTAVPFTKLVEIVANILILTVVELVGFIGLLVVLRRKFGISPLYQLAFVLETHVRTVQGHLIVWTVFILRMPLKHNGVASDIHLQ